MLKYFVILPFAFCATYAAFYEELSTKLIPEILSKKPLWKPGLNPYFKGKSQPEMSKLMGYRPIPDRGQVPKVYPKVTPQLPGIFDARREWSDCSTIGFIRDQASCGSCWAVSSAEAQSDRMCIGWGDYNVYLSDEDILSCCTFCGSGCNGGDPLMAWKYWKTKGVVTGGPYGSDQGCLPYEIPPCGPQGCATSSKTPKCQKTCEPSYTVSYKNDKNSGSTWYSVGNGASGMQQELYSNGPIVAAFNVYEDFYNYVSGVYHHVSGQLVGGHAVKVIGWGTENGTPYWLVANSWNITWGLNGYFKILRGSNECGFEEDVSAGLA